MKEIGGYLELEKLINNEYYTNMLRLNCANSALLLAIKENNIQKIYFPYYLCKSVFNVCEKNDINYDFYNIDENFIPKFDIELGENEYLYLVNYYGFFGNDVIAEYKNKFKNIIVDNVQAFFQKPFEDTITVYSCRKFFGVPDGAYLNMNCDNLNIEEYESVNSRLKHIVGRQEFSASEFYSDYIENEKKLGQIVIKKMSKFTKNILGAIPYDEIIETRENNFDEYSILLSSRNRIKIVEGIIAPFCYPLYVENGAELRKKLIENKVYIPTLWPNVEKEQTFEFDLKNNLIQLPCDQRYTLDDVRYICNLIK